MMNVLLVDDHPLVNYGLAACLEETGNYTVIGHAATLAEAKSFLKTPLPNIVILDIMLGEENGLDFLDALKDYCQANTIPVPAVLVCSVLEDPFRIRTALSQGASGYISKSRGKDELLKAIDTISRGETYVSDEHKEIFTEPPAYKNRFTKREQTILQLVKQNNTNQQIAKALDISVRTVENHISNIYFKTKTKTRQELMRM